MNMEIMKQRLFRENRPFILRFRIVKEQASDNNIPYSSYFVCIIFSLRVHKIIMLLKSGMLLRTFLLYNVFKSDNKTEKH